MSDPRIADALTLFRTSPTGTGARAVGGNAAVQSSYAMLIKFTVDKLLFLHKVDAITWHPLKWDLTGETELGGSGEALAQYIWINKQLEPNVWTWPSPGDQCLLAFSSLAMVHEAVHHVGGFRRDLTEEINCRTIELTYYQDLRGGRHYTSEFTGKACFARAFAAGPKTTFLSNKMDAQLDMLRKDQLLDYALQQYQEYQTLLKPSWVVAHLNAWGGLRNRTMATRGLYLSTLAPSAWTTHAIIDALLDILESLQTPLDFARTGVNPIDITNAMGVWLNDPSRAHRMKLIQKRLKIDLGVDSLLPVH